MSPTYTMSAHLCKQIYSSWRQTRQGSPESSPLPSPPTGTSYMRRSPSPSEKTSMDHDRSDVNHHPVSRHQQSQNSNGWRWSSR
ncbi:hypothetical protein B0T17DRAFT_496800 [Bombardia bombarda]|uniref:Ste12 interacting protein n=1 Tax=Bombardia bombarda TaxID=252184 RepID=A0AA39WIH3_9PEZI|nr:hypothetical protein B0T17DRAFT_496800 [Bombardia bombarda]